MPVFLLLLLAVCMNIAGDYAGKFWSVHQKPWIFLIAFGLYALAGLLYLPSLLKEGLIVTSLIWTILTVVGFVLVGLLIFHEHLTTMQLLGVGLGVAAVVLLSL